MAKVHLPAMVRPLTQADWVQAQGQTVREVLDDLERRFPGLRDRLCVDERLRPGVAVSVDGRLAPRGLWQPVQDDSEIHFLPAIGGG